MANRWDLFVLTEHGRHECTECGQRFNAGPVHGKPPRVCSHRCYLDRRKRSLHEQRSCGWCGKAFTCTRDKPTRACCLSHAQWLTSFEELGPICRRIVRRVWVSGRCADCDEWFLCPMVLGATMPRYCSNRCSGRKARHDREARAVGAAGSYRWVDFIGIHLAMGRRCAYCTQPIVGQPEPDHVVPLSRGGWNDVSNLLPACGACNAHKNDMTPVEWAAERARLGLPERATDWTTADPRAPHLVMRDATGTAWRHRAA